MPDARKPLPEYLVTSDGRRVPLRVGGSGKTEAVTVSKKGAEALRKAQGGPEEQRDE